MKNSTISKNIIFLLFIIPNLIGFSQDSSKIIMLSRDIGLVVDLGEKVKYDILPRFKDDFVSALFYLSADSLYNCKARLRKDSIVTDTILTLNYNSIRNTAMRVQYLENLKKGYSNFNIQNVKLVFANNEEVQNIEKSSVKKNFKESITDNAKKPNSLERINIIGNRIIITKTDKSKIEGELIEIKDSSLNVLIDYSAQGIFNKKNTLRSIHFSEIQSVRIINESKVLSSMGYGFLIGAGIGAVLGLASGDDEGSFISFSAETKALMFGVALGLAGSIIGLAVGVNQSEDEELIIRDAKDLNYLYEFSREAKIYKDTTEVLEPSSFGTDLQLNKPATAFNKKIESSIFFATTSSGPAEGIEDQMRKFGFDKTSYSSWFNAGSINHPKSQTGLGQLGTPWMISLKYYFTKNLLFGAFYSGNPIGWTTGYNNNGDYLHINYSISTIAAMSWYKYYNISLGLGPAIFLTNAYENEIFNNNKNYESTKIGLVVEAGITYPAQSTFFVSVIAQYRFMGNVNIGSFVLNNHSALPKFNICYNHVFVGFGAGIRI